MNPTIVGLVILVSALVSNPAPTSPTEGLIANSFLEQASPEGTNPAGFVVTGDALYGPLGDPETDRIGRGVRLLSGRDENHDGTRAGA